MFPIANSIMTMFRFKANSISQTFVFIFCLFTSPLRANDLVIDSGLWSQVEGHFKLENIDPKLNRFRLWTTGEARFFNDFDRFGQGIVRFVPGYQFNDNIALFFGYTWLSTILSDGRTLHEHNINQAMNWSTSTDWGGYSARSMIEWRFVDYDSQMATRFRQKIRGIYRLQNIHPHLSLIGWEEVFINVYSVDWGPESGFDQNRVFAGFGWQFDSTGHYTFEVGYMNQYISRPQQDDLMNHMLLSSLQIRF